MEKDNELLEAKLNQFRSHVTHVSQPSLGAPISKNLQPKSEPIPYVRYVHPGIKTTGHDSVGTVSTTISGESEGGESSKHNKKGKGKSMKEAINGIRMLIFKNQKELAQFAHNELENEVDDDIATRSMAGLDEKWIKAELMLNNGFRNNRPRLPKRKPKKPDLVDPSNSRFFKGQALNNLGSDDSPQHESVQITNELNALPSGNEIRKAKSQVTKVEVNEPSIPIPPIPPKMEAPVKKSRTDVSEGKNSEQAPPLKTSSPTPSKVPSDLVVQNVYLEESVANGDVVIDIAPPPVPKPKPAQKREKVVKAEKPREIVDQYDVFYQQGIMERRLAAFEELSQALDEYEEETERYRKRSKRLCCSLSLLALLFVAFVAAASYAFITEKVVFIDEDGVQHSVADFFKATALNNNNS